MELNDKEQTAIADLIGYAANPETWPVSPDADVIRGIGARLGFAEGSTTIADLLRKIGNSQIDRRHDNTGLDDGPMLPSARKYTQRKLAKSPDEKALIRAKAWATRREKYGERGHS